MRRFSLNGTWDAVCRMPDGNCFSLPGQVPGSSINDLVNAGSLPKDLFWRDNADSVQKYERSSFEYTLEFDFAPVKNEKYILRFLRLDTYCRVYLNGMVMGECMDEHIPHAFDVTDRLRAGMNRITIYFDSPVVRAEAMPERSGAFTTERMNTRRTQCTYSWDWVARFVGCGISGDVCIEAWKDSEVRVAGAYIYTKAVDEESAAVGIDVDFENRPGRIIELRILSPDGQPCRTVSSYCGEDFMRVGVDIPQAQLWYPRGYGAQPLYTLEILDGEDVVHREIFGIRTVRIVQLPDEKDSENERKCREIKNAHYDRNEEFSGFILKVNGVKVLCKGANWVPCEPYCMGSTDGKIERTLSMAAQCGLNMLRIWGGGTFETKFFYEECSRLGIMVTQDFLMACGQYPEEEEWFIDCLRKEVEFAARHIRNEPCLMWWSGDNENAVDGCALDADYMGRRSAYEGIAPVLYRLDPYREFLPSSPYGGRKYASNTVGTTHNTQFLGTDILPYMMGDDCEDYREAWKKFRARFIAEEPQLGAVSPGSVRRFMAQEDISGDDDAMWKYHTRSNPALSMHLYDISLKFARNLLGSFASAEDRFFKLRYLQYEWVRFTMEQLRREMWFCSGLIYWMFNDCWPAASGWALVDYYNKPKDGWYAFKRCAGRVVLSLDYEDGRYVLYVSNEGSALTDARIQLKVVGSSGVREVEDIGRELPAYSTVPVKCRELTLEDGEVLVAEISVDGIYDRTFYQHGAMKMHPAEVHMEQTEDAVIVRADGYVHAVELEGECVFDDNCFSLLPGEVRKIGFSRIGSGEITATAYTILQTKRGCL